jgi:hypothetical protein
MADKLPYLATPGSLTKTLEKIKSAATPEHVTYDFISTVIGIKGGTGRSLIPFLKRAGLVKSEGTPSDLYHQFRNASTSKKAAATAFRMAYKPLFARNEFAYKLSDDDLKGIIVEATGDSVDSRVTQLTIATIKVFKPFCDFEGKLPEKKGEASGAGSEEKGEKPVGSGGGSTDFGIRLGYTINLNLPATDDIKVFDAIFRSLKEHLLKE